MTYQRIPIRFLLSWKPLIRMISAIFLTSVIFIVFYSKNPEIEPDYINEEIKVEVSERKPGDNGKPVYLEDNRKEDVKSAYKTYGFNQIVSDMISVNRSLPDMRPLLCRTMTYSPNKFKVSVIIVFYEEGWSTLIRTVMSVINRSSRRSLLEIIVVDDHSTLEHLKSRLDDFAQSTKGLVRVVRMNTHEGLIRARITGADEARGDILIFLDSHCEASPGWLPPLLEPIRRDYRTVTCPTIDGIEHNTFEYKPYGRTARGTFSWQFHYKERPPIGNSYRDSDHVPSPVMAGGLFAISVKFWQEIGKYDPGLYIWGGEQYELSFKLWMCGGSMYNEPCSKVGHVYRGPGIIRGDQGLSQSHPNAVNVNYKRVAEVWMDEYKHYLYMKRPYIKNAINFDVGLQERHELRAKLKCHDFKWYLQNVVNDTLFTAYEPDRANSVIKLESEQLCIEEDGSGKDMRIRNCHPHSKQFRWTWINEIREEEHCFTAKDDKIIWDWCHETQGPQRFLYRNDFSIYNEESRKCIETENNLLKLKACDELKLSQKWLVVLNDLSIPDEWAKYAIHAPRKP